MSLFSFIKRLLFPPRRQSGNIFIAPTGFPGQTSSAPSVPPPVKRLDLDASQFAPIVRERDTGRPRGFAFIEMASDSDAQAAISQLNEQPFGGRPLIVNEARPMAPRSGAGHGAGGGRSRREPRW